MSDEQRHAWEIRTQCSACGGTVYGSGETNDDPDNGYFEDRRAMCYQCGASYTVFYATGTKTLQLRKDDDPAV